MADQTLKKDAGKARMDLIPFRDFDVSSTMGEAYQALQDWYVRLYAGERPDLIVPHQALPGVAQVLAMGAAKYSERGWEAGIPFSRIFAAAARHATSEGNDPESGLPHEAHFWCNVIFILTFINRGQTELDDRPNVAWEYPRRG